MMKRVLFLTSVIAMVILSSCSSLGLQSTNKTPLAEATNTFAYGYHPIDPLPIDMNGNANADKLRILAALPDETMRLSIGYVENNGRITYGPIKAGVAGNNYVVVLDYLKFETKSIAADVTDSETGRYAAVTSRNNPDLVVPAYVGVGIRLTANIFVNSGSLDLGNFFALGTAAENGQISGTLIIQTLGISGEGISSSIPMPSELSESSVQAAILTMGTIKAKLYEKQTIISPRIVAIYNNLGENKDIVSSFINSILQQPLELKLAEVEESGAPEL
jgi:hypothetical protein